MTQLQKSVVLITGAAGGFGQELTRQLLIAGSQLILTDLELDVLQTQVKIIQNQVKNGEVIACFGVDLSSAEGCQSLYKQVKALDIPIDILINNAGIALFGRMDEIPSEKWERLMQINLLTPMRLSALFVADMIARQQGHIVNISSLAGWVGMGGMAHYNASKFGLRGFSEGLFSELKSYNIKVTTVYPFFSRTPILQSERFGTLAAENLQLPDNLITDPAEVMRQTIEGIVRDRLEVFPDTIAHSSHILKRYFPGMLNWCFALIERRLKNSVR